LICFKSLVVSSVIFFSSRFSNFPISLSFNGYEKL
jgi:hypothetical protein